MDITEDMARRLLKYILGWQGEGQGPDIDDFMALVAAKFPQLRTAEFEFIEGWPDKENV